MEKNDDELFDILTNKYDESDIEKLLNSDETFNKERLFDFLFGKRNTSNEFSSMIVTQDIIDISPNSLAGHLRGSVMSFNDADSGKVNPKFGKAGYDINCQSGVVAFESRLRGYDVTAAARNSTSDRVAKETRLAWIDPNTNKKPKYIDARKVTDSASCYKWLDKKIEKDARYTFEFDWKNSNNGHIISAFKDNSGKVVLYDPQINELITGSRVKLYLNDIDHNSIRKDYTGKITYVGTKLLRVDNLSFNEKIVNKILE